MGKTFKLKKWVAEGRENEKIGGGYFVFRRGGNTRRIRPAYWPFEHATEEAAMRAAMILAEANPGQLFEVFGSLGAVSKPPVELPAEQVAEPA